MTIPPLAQTNVQLLADVAASTSYADADADAIDRAYRLARSLHPATYRANGKPFVAHLLGTASVLVHVGAPVDVVCAALLHAAYPQGDFGSGLHRATPLRRRLVRRVVGADVERIVHDYADVARRSEGAAAMIWLANELEEAIDNGRASGELASLAAGARDIGADGLARWFEAVPPTRPAPERAEHDHSFVVLPRSVTTRVRPRLVALGRALRSRRRPRDR